MCGIVGCLGNITQDIEFETLVNIMHHRGPDAHGSIDLENGRLQLGHVRLAILDLNNRSNQPLRSNCGNYILVFNGEIYNFKMLRELLSKKGYTFKTQSDTEVLLYWLIDNGASGINKLDGMFAFCFYDRKANKLLLARDHIGEKPLYYAIENNNFAFSSEIKLLTKLSWVDQRLHLEALKNYLHFLYTAPPHTLYAGVKELPPGHYLVIDTDDIQLEISSYFNLVDHLAHQPEIHSARHDSELFKKEFSQTIDSRLISDVPVGMYLSAGLDSNAIVAQAKSAHSTNFCTYTISYANDNEANEYDESQGARDCANYYGVTNRSIELDLSIDFLSMVKKSNDIFGQPFGNATCLVAEQLASVVSKSHKVCLIGDGGDELLAGYPRYKALKLHYLANYLPSILFTIILHIIAMIPENRFASTKIRRIRQFLEGCRLPISHAYLKWVGYQEYDTINKALKTTGTTKYYDDLAVQFKLFENDPPRAAAIVDFLSFVPFNLLQAADRTSMANSLELRSPFVAKDLVLSMLNMSSKNKFSWQYNKPLLVEGLKNILPNFILKKPKRPFNPPMRGLISKNFTTIRKYLSDHEHSQVIKLLSHEFIESELNTFEFGERDNSTYLWGLCTLECWLRENQIDFNDCCLST